jgi:hypothetical protein
MHAIHALRSQLSVGIHNLFTGAAHMERPKPSLQCRSTCMRVILFVPALALLVMTLLATILGMVAALATDVRGGTPVILSPERGHEVSANAAFSAASGRPISAVSTGAPPCSFAPLFLRRFGRSFQCISASCFPQSQLSIFKGKGFNA